MPRFLVHFVTSKLADFAVAEFKALADMVGGVPGGDVIVNECVPCNLRPPRRRS